MAVPHTQKKPQTTEETAETTTMNKRVQTSLWTRSLHKIQIPLPHKNFSLFAFFLYYFILFSFQRIVAKIYTMYLLEAWCKIM